MSVATQQKYPSLAEIVRQETDGGRLIVQFYLGVANGTLDGFRDHHRMSAARRIDKIAPKLVSEYLLKYANAQVRPSMRGSLFPMGRISPITKNPPEGSEQATRGPSVFQRRLTQLVREETGDGRTIFNFLNGVMHGTYTGFKPHHRLEAAKELASYITNDHSPSTPWEPAPAQSLPRTRYGAGTHPPTPSTGEVLDEGNSPVIPAEGNLCTTVIPVATGTHPPTSSPGEGLDEGDSPVIPAEGDLCTTVIPVATGTHPSSPSTGEGLGEGDSPVIPAEGDLCTTVIPVATGTHPSSPSTGEGLDEGDSPVIPAEAGTHPPSPSTGEVLDEGDSPVIPAEAGTHPPSFSAVNPPISLAELEQANFDSSHISRYSFARDEITGAIYAFDHIGPIVVDDDGVTYRIPPSRIAGYRRASRTNENQYLTRKTTHTQRRRQQNHNTRTGNSRPETKNSPSRSPPRFWV